MAAAVELKLASGEREEDGARHDAVERLASAIDIGGAGEACWKAIGFHIGHDAEVAGGARYGIGGRGIEAVILLHPAFGAAINLGRRDMHIGIEEIDLAQP